MIIPEYDNSHRAFLQALLARASWTFEQARPILAAISNAHNGNESEVLPEQITQEIFQDYIEVASDAASLFDYEIRSIIDQVTKQRMYALVNTQSDPQTQLATIYSAEELAFIKRVLDGIFDKYNTPRMEVVAITEMQAIKFAKPPLRRSEIDLEESTPTDTQSVDRGLKHGEAEAVLKSLVEAGWFSKSQHGFYSLTARAILELRPWLLEVYNDAASGDAWQKVKFCEACKEIVTFGLRCSEPDCVLRLHDMCQDAFWRARRSKKCPKCDTVWQGNRYVGERAVTETEAYRRGRRRSGGRRATLADEVINQTSIDAAADDDDDDDDE